MCLKLFSDKEEDIIPLVAKDDIVVYKAMDVYFKDNKTDERLLVEKVMTPFRYAKLPFEQRIQACGQIRIRKNVYSDFEINGGVFHSYKNLTDAIRDVRTYGTSGNKTIIFKAIIPAGTEYYKGEFSDYACFGSRELILTKEVVHEELFDPKARDAVNKKFRVVKE